MSKPDPIADFLRRAAERRGQQAPAQRQVVKQIVDADVVEDAEIIEADEVVAEDVARHVARRLDTSRIEKHVSQLGAEIDRSDDVMEAHLQDAFQHKLGDLGARTAAAEESVLDDDAKQKGSPSAPPAQMPQVDILGMIRRPQELRIAIVLNEILTRPEHRW